MFVTSKGRREAMDTVDSVHFLRLAWMGLLVVLFTVFFAGKQLCTVDAKYL
jgi:hypothetical protein